MLYIFIHLYFMNLSYKYHTPQKEVIHSFQDYLSQAFSIYLLTCRYQTSLMQALLRQLQPSYPQLTSLPIPSSLLPLPSSLLQPSSLLPLLSSLLSPLPVSPDTPYYLHNHI